MTVYRDGKSGLWRFDYWHKGRRWTGRGLKSEVKARRAEQRHRDQVERGLTNPHRTFELLVEAWLEDGARTKSRWHLYCSKHELQRAFRHLYKMAPTAITVAHVEPTLHRLAKTRKASTVNSYRKTINAVMNYGVRTQALLYNPLRGIPTQPKDDRRVEPIPTGDLQRLVLAADPIFAAKLTFIAQTGCRWREHARLLWSEVFLDGPEPFAVLTTKKNRGGRIRKRPQPLTAPAVRAVKLMRGRSDLYVFPGPKGDANRYTTDYARLVTLCEDIGIPRYGFHQLRHWTGLMATSMGKSRRAVADYLGHTGTTATELYMHALKPELWEVAQKLEREWDELVSGGTFGGTQSGVRGVDPC